MRLQSACLRDRRGQNIGYSHAVFTTNRVSVIKQKMAPSEKLNNQTNLSSQMHLSTFAYKWIRLLGLATLQIAIIIEIMVIIMLSSSPLRFQPKDAPSAHANKQDQF